MSVEITRTVKEVTITITREENQVIIQPVISKRNGVFDGTIDGGTP